MAKGLSATSSTNLVKSHERRVTTQLIRPYFSAVLAETLPEVDKAEVWVTRGVALVVAIAVALGVDWFTQARQGAVYGWTIAAWLIFIFLVYTPARLFQAQVKKIHDYEEARRPKLRIVFTPSNETDSRPYLQTLYWFNHQNQSIMVDRRYRVGIHNMSFATVSGASVLLENCTPPANFAFPDHRLLAQDSDPPLGERDVPVNDHDNAAVWFDVVNELGREGEIPKTFKFCYANPKLAGEVPAGVYDIVVRVEGGEVPVRKSFRITKVDEAGQVVPLRMTPR